MSYLDLSAANSPSIQSKVSIFLKRKVFSGFSANGLTSKAKNDLKVANTKIASRHLLGEFSLRRSLFPQCALDATGFLSDVYKRSTRAKKLQADDVQFGKSMIEMLGVLAIIGVLSVGGIAGYSKAMTKFKTNKVADNVSMLVANIKTAYAQQNTYTDLNNANAVSIGVVPDELVVKDSNGAYSKLLNAFNGSVYISQSDSTNPNDGKAFIIEFGSLSKEACIALATNDWGAGYSSGLIALQVQGTSAANTATSGKSTLNNIYIGQTPKSASSNTTIAMPGATESTSKRPSRGTVGTITLSITPVPMPAAAAAAACSCNTGNNCSISWKYY